MDVLTHSRGRSDLDPWSRTVLIVSNKWWFSTIKQNKYKYAMLIPIGFWTCIIASVAHASKNITSIYNSGQRLEQPSTRIYSKAAHMRQVKCKASAFCNPQRWRGVLTIFFGSTVWYLTRVTTNYRNVIKSYNANAAAWQMPSVYHFTGWSKKSVPVIRMQTYLVNGEQIDDRATIYRHPPQ